MIGIILTVGWMIIGAINLCSNNGISKLSYFITWSVLMVSLINHYFM